MKKMYGFENVIYRIKSTETEDKNKKNNNFKNIIFQNEDQKDYVYQYASAVVKDENEIGEWGKIYKIKKQLERKHHLKKSFKKINYN